MSVALLVLGWLLVLPLALITLPFLVEIAAGLAPARRAPSPPATVPATVILMPAHDEAAQIAAVLQRIQATLPPGMRLLVIADNCSDDTAAVARAAGAEVIERVDPARRGKGFALGFGRDHLAAAPPACVIVVDADCVPAPGALARLAAGAVARDAAVQSVYLMAPRPAAPAVVQISSFAFLVKNLLRQRGLARIGAPVLLGGTGMAFPWRLFAGARLATADIVEDLAFAIALIEAREPPRFDGAATVWTDPADAAGTMSQRTRWENGFIAVATRRALPLIGAGLRRRRGTLLWTGLTLLTPPLALLVMLLLAGAALTGMLALAGMPPAPFVTALALLALVGLLVLAAWAGYGRAYLKPATLLRLPLYILWKLPIYLRLLRGRVETRWVRTERNRWE